MDNTHHHELGFAGASHVAHTELRTHVTNIYVVVDRHSAYKP